MSEGKKLLRAGSFSFMAQVAQLGTNFLLFLVLVRLLPERQFGIWVLYLTIISFAEMTRVGFVQNGFVKFSSDHPDDYPKILTVGLISSLVLGVILALVVSLITIPLSHWWSAPELLPLIWFYFPYALTFGCLRFVEFVCTVHQNFKAIFFSYALYGIFLFLGVIGLWWFVPAWTLAQLVLVQSGAALLALLMILVYTRSYWTFGPFRLSWLKKLFHFGKYVFGSNFSSMLFNRMDTIMLGFFVSPAAIAVYNVAMRINNYLEVPLTSLAMVIYPRLAAANKDGKERVGKLYEKSLTTLLAIIVPLSIGVLVGAYWLVYILAGPNYIEATYILQIFVFAGLIKPWGRMFGITLDAIGRPQLNLSMLLLGLITNLVFNGILIPFYGIYGAAWGTLLAIWVNIIVGQVLISKIISVDHKRAIVEVPNFLKTGFMWLYQKLPFGA